MKLTKSVYLTEIFEDGTCVDLKCCIGYYGKKTFDDNVYIFNELIRLRLTYNISPKYQSSKSTYYLPDQNIVVFISALKVRSKKVNQKLDTAKMYRMLLTKK
jgi:hypothetical protein